MADVERDRRRNPEKSIIRFFLETFGGKQGRKAMFGMWGFVAANALINAGKIDQGTYWHMFLTCALLIGFGTVLDSVVEKFGDAVAAMAGDKVNAMLGKRKEGTDVQPNPEVPKA